MAKLASSEPCAVAYESRTCENRDFGRRLEPVRVARNRSPGCLAASGIVQIRRLEAAGGRHEGPTSDKRAILRWI